MGGGIVVSGILGIMNLRGKPVLKEDLDRMLDSMRHRGPDGCSTWQDGAIGIGHLLMHITPESVKEKSPYVSPVNNLVITADARIDNREELFEGLSIPPGDRQEITDSLLILKSFEKWGENCPAYLLGEFSFAIWDKRNRVLFCARDHMGFRPFFYYYSSRHFIFASEAKSIRALSFITSQLNETKLATKLLPLEIDHEQTIFKNIMRLKCAHTLTVKKDKLATHAYWNPGSPKEFKFSSPDDYAVALRQLVLKSVHCRLRTKRDLQVGITLSGGLDSSAIACIAARCLQKEGRRLIAVSSVLPLNHKGIETDERQYIQAVLDQEPNIDIQYVTTDGITPFDDLETSFEELENMVKPFQYMDRALWKAASNKGVRVLLSGGGGDNMASFDGRDSLARLARQSRWGSVIKLARQLSIIEGVPLSKILKRRLFLPLLSEWFLNLYFYLKGNKKQDAIEIETPLNLDFVRKYDVKPAVFKKRSQFITRDCRSQLLSKIKSGKFVVDGENIRQSYFGMCSLLPFFDKRIVEFFLGIPPEQLLLGGWKRSLFRRAMEGILPPAIQWRKDKHPYTPDFHCRVLSAKQEMLKFLNSIKKDDPVRQYIDIERIKWQFDRIRPAKGRYDWETRTQGIVVQGIILIKFLQWVKSKKRIEKIS
jgi:asparagine synthase (glutamine-hydrolysing)